MDKRRWRRRVTNDVFVIFQASPPGRPLSFLCNRHVAPPARASSISSPFAAFPGSRFTRRGSDAGDAGGEKRKATKGERRRGTGRPGAGKINCWRRCTTIKSVLTGP